MTQSQQSYEVEQLREKLKIAIEALEFYASPWGPHLGSPIISVNKFCQNKLNESGERARQALAKLKGKT